MPADEVANLRRSLVLVASHEIEGVADLAIEIAAEVLGPRGDVSPEGRGQDHTAVL